ncbi:OLC1v1013827C1 [Oldenlandia corymbosa var. corymbosa]|uniref:GAGA-binding transcriptional activator n=1 Tax=Oldenlandia corymbosa var. corymbosa TaxID=529605 RepID=A0AAV1E038_OLDCO|nr:OLC1v1013827C1 [Oldenlandia corymbosa var. corymbosa]
MDGNGSLNLRNWGFMEPEPAAFKGNLGLQLMSTMNEKPLFGGVRDHHHYQYHHPYQAHSTVMAPSTNGGPYHHHRVGGFLESSAPMDYMREVYNREKYMNVLTNNHQNHPQLSYGAFPETSSSHSVEMIQQSNFLDTDNVCRQEVENCEIREAVGTAKKRGSDKIPKSPKAKKPKKAPKPPREDCGRSLHRPRAPKKAAEIFINGRSLDLSKFPIPVCTCTGTAQYCYRWGAGGWQSACCTTGMSVYPLPMSTKRRGARIAGRKMSLGAFRKVLEKLDSEGFDLSKSIDLKNHWAKHGTNKFVTIR